MTPNDVEFFKTVGKNKVEGFLKNFTANFPAGVLQMPTKSELNNIMYRLGTLEKMSATDRSKGGPCKAFFQIQKKVSFVKIW